MKRSPAFRDSSDEDYGYRKKRISDEDYHDHDEHQHLLGNAYGDDDDVGIPHSQDYVIQIEDDEKNEFVDDDDDQYEDIDDDDDDAEYEDNDDGEYEDINGEYYDHDYV